MLEVAHGHHKQVGRVGQLHLPGVGAQAGAGGRAAGQLAVAQRHVLAGHGHGYFRSSLLVGPVDGREPGRGALRLALGPDLHRLAGYAAVGVDEVEALGVGDGRRALHLQLVGLGRVLDVDGVGRAGRPGLAEVDVQHVLGVAVLELLLLLAIHQRHRLDVHALGVEVERVDGVGVGLSREPLLAVEVALLVVEAHGELGVDQGVFLSSRGPVGRRGLAGGWGRGLGVGRGGGQQQAQAEQKSVVHAGERK